jgi:hypothetical protein
MDLGLLEEFRFDWELAGKAARTVDDYIAALRLLFAQSPEPDLGAPKAWVASTSYASVRRKAPRRSGHSAGGPRGRRGHIPVVESSAPGSRRAAAPADSNRSRLSGCPAESLDEPG